VTDRGDIVFSEHMAIKWLLYVKKEKIEYKKETSKIRRLALKEKKILLFIILFLG
jgi:hypothetical protein